MPGFSLFVHANSSNEENEAHRFTLTKPLLAKATGTTTAAATGGSCATPLCEASSGLCQFRVPTKTEVDAQLFVGAVLFGMGWGLTGVCPAPALFLASQGVPRVILAWWPLYVVGAAAAECCTNIIRRRGQAEQYLQEKPMKEYNSFADGTSSVSHPIDLEEAESE